MAAYEHPIFDKRESFRVEIRKQTNAKRLRERRKLIIEQMMDVQPELSETIEEIVLTFVKSYDEQNTNSFIAALNALERGEARIRYSVAAANSLLERSTEEIKILDDPGLCRLVNVLAIEVQKSPQLSGACWQLVEFFVRVLLDEDTKQKLPQIQIYGITQLFCNVLISQRDAELLVWATRGARRLVPFDYYGDEHELMGSLISNITQDRHSQRLTVETLLLLRAIIDKSASPTSELFCDAGGLSVCIDLLEDSFAAQTSSEVITSTLQIIPTRLEPALNTHELLARLEGAILPTGILYTNALMRLLLNLINAYEDFASKVLKYDRLVKYLQVTCVNGESTKNELAESILRALCL